MSSEQVRARLCRRPAIERVWAHIAKAGPDECWLWTGSLDKHGRARIGPAIGEVIRVAPRVILEAKLGRPLLPGMFACHTCDTPPCCNEAHLYEGTHQQNMRDMVERHRQRTVPQKGEANPFAKLTAPQVAAIRNSSQPVSVLASEYRVSVSHVRRLRRGVGWTG